MRARLYSIREDDSSSLARVHESANKPTSNGKRQSEECIVTFGVNWNNRKDIQRLGSIRDEESSDQQQDRCQKRYQDTLTVNDLKSTFSIHLFTIYRKLLRRLRFALWSTYNEFLLGMQGAEVGNGFRSNGLIYIRVRKRGQISLGRHVWLVSHPSTNLVGLTNPCVLHCRQNGKIIIGDHSGLSAGVISSQSSITVGQYVKLGGNVRIFDHDFHALDYSNRRDGAKDLLNCRTKPVAIGDDVFVGANSIILKGVKIGDRSIIGAGSVVSCDVPPDEVWAGNPARLVKKLEQSSNPLGRLF